MIPRSWGNSQIIVKGYTRLGKLASQAITFPAFQPRLLFYRY
jgi:hypothetical protein